MADLRRRESSRPVLCLPNELGPTILPLVVKKLLDPTGFFAIQVVVARSGRTWSATAAGVLGAADGGGHLVADDPVADPEWLHDTSRDLAPAPAANP